MAQAPVIGIVGMRALRRDLRAATDDVRGPLYKAISAAGKAAVEPIAAHVRASLPVGDRDTGRRGMLLASVRGSGTRTGGAVKMGNKRTAWAGWVDFGGSRPDGSSRDFVSSGRYLFPAAEGLASEAAARYGAAIERVFASSALWTNTTNDGTRVRD